jgi:6-phosphofructokinase 1
VFYAGRNGIIGALSEDLIDISARESPKAIAALRNTPGGAFGSCRYKLKGIDENRAQYERLIDVFRAHAVGYFFYNGGNDSADTCLKVSQIADKLGYPLTAVHVPKTVDNDLPITEQLPGFGSRGQVRRNVDARGGVRCCVHVQDVDQGVRAGGDGPQRRLDRTAAVGMADSADTPIPLLLLFPEIPFDQAELRSGRCPRQALRLLLPACPKACAIPKVC